MFLSRKSDQRPAPSRTSRGRLRRVVLIAAAVMAVTTGGTALAPSHSSMAPATADAAFYVGQKFGTPYRASNGYWYSAIVYQDYLNNGACVRWDKWYYSSRSSGPWKFYGWSNAYYC